MAYGIPDFDLPPPPGVLEEPFPPEFGAPPQPYEVDGMAPPFDPSMFAPPDGSGFATELEGPPQLPIGQLPPEQEFQAVPDFQPPPAPGGPPGAPVPFSDELPGPPGMPGAIPAGLPPPPGQEANVLRGVAQQPSAPISDIEELYNLRARQEDVGANALLANEQAYKQRLDMIQLKQKQRDEVAQKAADDVASSWDEVKNTKIDDKGLWNGMSDAQKAVSFIGAVIGGFLAARQGGPNRFMESYQRMVEQNIATQKANLANKTRVAEALDTGYSRMLARFGDEKTADFMTAATMYNAGKNEALAKAGLMKSDITRQEGVLAAQQLDAAARGALSKAQQQQFENGMKLAEFQQKSEHDMFTARTGRISAYETGRHNRATEGINAAELELKKKAAGPKAIPLYGKEGPAAGPVGYAGDDEVAKRAAIQMEGMSELDALAKRGEELLKDDYAVYGSDRRVEIEQWNAAWQNARFRASGRTDAPSEQERKTSGIDPSRVIGDNRVAFRESYNTARSSAAAKLRTAGVADDYLKRAGWIDPPKAPKVTGRTEEVIYKDDDGTYNTEGRGVPLSGEEERIVKANRAKFESGGRTASQGKDAAEAYRKRKLERAAETDPVELKYQRQQNAIAQRSGRPLPFPKAGL